MDRRKVTFFSFLFLTVLAPSGLQLIRQKTKKNNKKNKERTDVYEYCLSVFRPGSFCLRTSI